MYVEEIAGLLGGRVAEEMFTKTISSGASSDLQKATKIAKRVISQYGLCESFSVDRVYDESLCSEKSKNELNKEIDILISSAKKLAKEILTKHKEELNLIVTELLKDEKNDLRALILCAIIDSYEDMFIQLVANKCGSEEEARRQVLEHFEKNGYVPMNIRENDTTDVVNSAHTDRAILTFSTDMAALLATSKAFLSVRGNNEFDIVSKGYNLND